jgi:CO/xanthine dehydrogenase Mo-binding subunit
MADDTVAGLTVCATSNEAPEPERYEFLESRRYVFDLDRRDFIRLFGAGLVVFVAAGDVLAQESGRAGGGRQPSPPGDLAAWLHIDESGRARVCTGKVEIGQNIRTSLTQAVADELHVPVSSVTLVMGDTDLTPFDMGTFGSRTTPTMAPQLSRAAATARQMLVARAAARWRADPASLRVEDGIVHHPDGRTASYGDLVKGQALAGTIPADAAVENPRDWKLRGRAVSKIDGKEFVTGRHRYTPDVVRPDMQYGRVVRPEGYNARLVSVDDSKARAMAGVTVVRDGDFVGVVAPSERVAVRAANAIATTWDVPKGQPSSDTVYDYLKANAERPEPAAVGSAALPSGAREFKASYHIPYIAHVPLEPRAAVAEWSDGRVTVWTGTQRPFAVRGEVAEAFHIPESRVRVIVPDTGSAYGGKHTGEAAVEAARLAQAAKRPVKLIWTREEEFQWAYFRPAGVIDVRGAVDASGRIQLWEFDNWNSGSAGLRSPYDIPVKTERFHPTKSPLRQGSYRALAATANHYAREMHMDAMARAVGADAVQFRLEHLSDARIKAALQAVADRIGWSSRGSRALGIACGTEKGGYLATAAEVGRAPKGFTVRRIVTAFEVGAIVNPDGLKNQVEGSIAQALGPALFEAVEFEDGRILNGTMSQYRLPRFQDVPPIDTILIDRRDLPSAGAGESSLVCLAPAIGAALRSLGPVDTALPVRMTQSG